MILVKCFKENLDLGFEIQILKGTTHKKDKEESQLRGMPEMALGSKIEKRLFIMKISLNYYKHKSEKISK